MRCVVAFAVLLLVVFMADPGSSCSDPGWGQHSTQNGGSGNQGNSQRGGGPSSDWEQHSTQNGGSGNKGNSQSYW